METDQVSEQAEASTVKQIVAFFKKYTPVIRFTDPWGHKGLFIGIRWTF